MPEGYLALHLHAHLPFVRHPEFPQFLEERWFFDAIVDTYVPLLARFEQLHLEGVPYRLSMTLTPTLLSMFADALLQERFERHLDNQLELCDLEMSRTQHDPAFRPVVELYQHRLNEVVRQFARYGGNLANGFRMLRDHRHLELVTCGATHAILPHLQLVPGAVARQLRYAVETHERLLGHAPDGIWLGECAYSPGLEVQMLEHGLAYFYADTHALLLGTPRSLRGVFSHVYLPNGIAAFGRDNESSKQVWSSKEGYPGDPWYREFYRDIGFDLPLEIVAPFIHDRKVPILTGFKYYRITGETDQKQPYDPQAAFQRSREHAQHFVWAREQQVRHLRQHMDRPPLILAPYDAELFGHWWFEGPEFLYHLLKAVAHSPVLQTIAARDYLLLHPSAQIVTPNTSSWGEGGYFRFWLNSRNEWLYPHVNAAARRLACLQMVPGPADNSLLRQAERELLLAQSSDWAFILSTGTSPGYASARVVQHLSNLGSLLDAAESHSELSQLGEMQARNNLF